MVVKKTPPPRGASISGSERGQSILEFLFFLPLMFGFVVVLLRVNTAIQMSIVDQQYARMQALFLTFNSPVYPSLTQQMNNFVPRQANMMVVGVSENIAPSTGTYTPHAPNFNITRHRVPADDGVNQQVPSSRARVRVRNTVALCTQSIVASNGGGSAQPILSLTGNAPDYQAAGANTLGENTQMDYCRSPYQ